MKVKPTLKVLSIDFDFFQVVDLDTLFHYPDGHDFMTDFSKFIWANHYADPREDEILRKVSVNQKLFAEIKDILISNASAEKPVMIANSHKYIYDFIVDEMNTKKWRDLAVVNVDMHHDMFNDNEKLDCGNWVSHIYRKFPGTYISWIANPISNEAYGLGENLMQLVQTDFSSIRNQQFDMIFLCRSDIWTPPHLDSYFDELYHLILEHYWDIRVDRQVSKPRDLTEELEAQKKVYAERIKMAEVFKKELAQPAGD
jgi:hypothetical protein